MTPKAHFRSGDPVMVDHTAASTLDTGDIVLVGNTAGWTCGVVHRPIANAAVGEIAAGGGVYDVKCAAAYAKGAKVYWDATNTVLTTTSTNMSLFGFLVEASTGVNDVARVLHKPYV